MSPKPATKSTRPRRTGLRKPTHYLKVWDDKDWTRLLTPRLRVGMVDEWLEAGHKGGRKSWYLALTQSPDLVKTLGPVRGAPRTGKTLLLFEDDVVALVRHCIEAELVVFEAERFVNGPAHDARIAAIRRERARDQQRKATKSKPKTD